MKTAELISDFCAPWIVNVVLFLVLGVSLDALGAGIIAATLTGVVPRAIIWVMMRKGSVSHHHVTQRSQRGPVFTAIVVCLAALVAALGVFGAPRELWIAVAAALALIVVFALVTLVAKVKISVHVGLWLTVWSYLGTVVSPWWLVGLLALPVVGWSRLKLGQHTRSELLGGVGAGLIVLVGALVAL